MRNITLIHTLIHLLQSLRLSAIVSSRGSLLLSFLLQEHWDETPGCQRLRANQIGKCLQAPMRWRGDLHEPVASINRSRRVTESSSDSTYFQSHLRPYSPFSLAQIKHPLFSPAGSVLTQTTHTSPNSSHSNSDYRHLAEQQLSCALWTCPNSETSHVRLLSSSQFRPYSFSFSGSVALQMPLTSPFWPQS